MLVLVAGCDGPDRGRTLAKCRMKAMEMNPSQDADTTNLSDSDYIYTCMKANGFRTNFSLRRCCMTTDQWDLAECYQPDTWWGRFVDEERPAAEPWARCTE